MATQVLTTDDLNEFKIQLIDELKKLLNHKATTSQKKYLKSTEVMKLLKVSPGTLQNLRINGTLPYSKIGGIIFYDEEEIISIMKENRIDNR